MDKLPAYVSFDYDNDQHLKHLFVGQAKNPKIPFEFADWSIKESITTNWKKDAEYRIRRSDLVIVLVGEKTHRAQGVLVEVGFARKHDKKIIQLKLADTNPTRVPDAGTMYNWTKDNLELIMSSLR